MSKIKCPACGSSNLSAVQHKKSNQLTLGGDFQYLETIYSCADCGEEGDFASQNDKEFDKAHDVALTAQVSRLIEGLSEKNVTMASFERAFELPQRTLTRWKGGDFSASSVALLRTVHTFPWILEAAEKRFAPQYADSLLVREGMRVFGQMATRYSYNWDASIVASLGTVVATGRIEFSHEQRISQIEEPEFKLVAGGRA